MVLLSDKNGNTDGKHNVSDDLNSSLLSNFYRISGAGRLKLGNIV